MGFPFSDHVRLLEQVLALRQTIVNDLERQLFGARGKANAQNGDLESIADIFQECFFESPALSPSFSRLNGTLDAAHLADGFEPARQDGYSRALDPAELALRACHHWDGTRWPGTNGRLVFAQSLYAVFVLRQLERLSLRIWDPSPGFGASPSTAFEASEGKDQAADRVQHVQRLLDLLNTSGRAHEIRLVRDARWLIQTAQGPLTRHVEPYFVKAGQILRLPNEVRLEIHNAGAVLAGGHLRSQLRHLSRRTGWAVDDPQLIALTRSSNSMDMALLVRDLVPRLEAYSAACARQDTQARHSLADAILQGLSADPELLLTRLDLLGPSTMIEDLFIDRGDTKQETRRLGGPGDFPKDSPNSPGLLNSCSTAMGEVHREYLSKYGELVGRTAESLLHDTRAYDPAHAPYSPFGIVYGFCTDLFSNMVLNTLISPASNDLTIEDMFNSRERLEEKRVQSDKWTHLPKREGERDPFEHSTEFAAHIYARLAAALEVRAAHPAEANASSFRKSHLYVVPCGVSVDSLAAGSLPAGVVSAQEHCLTSDVTRARLTGATALPADRLIADRAEGRLLACVQSEGLWFALSKVPLTLYTSQGKDAVIVDVPPGVVDVLRDVCPNLLVVMRQE